MLSEAPADAPWRSAVMAALARVAPSDAPQLAEDQIAAVQGMDESARTDMIRGMVERLAARLSEKGGDVEGWLRLMRAYMVLGEPDRARKARDDARVALRDDAGGLQRLNDGLKSLGLDG